MEFDRLRPLERRILRLSDEGCSDAEIGERFRRSADYVRRVKDLTDIPRSGRPRPAAPDGLRPLERRVLRWRAEGAPYTDVAERFRRTPGFVEQVEGLARYKLGD